MQEKWFTTLVIGLVCLGLAAYLVVFTVRENEVAVHYRLGRVKKIVRPRFKVPVAGSGSPSGQEVAEATGGVPVVNKAGWFFKLPPPFDKVHVYDQRIRHVDATVTQTLLKDQYPVIPRVYATWRITDPVGLRRSLGGDERKADATLRNIIDKQVGAVLGRSDLADLVNVDEKKLRFNEIEQEVLDLVKKDLEEQDFGLQVYGLGITWIALPRDTTPSVFQRMKSERANVAKRFASEGEAKRDQIIAEARRAQTEQIQNAEAEAKKIIADAEKKALAYYEEFAKDPVLAIFLRRLESFRKIAMWARDQRQPLTIVVTPGTEPFRVLRPGTVGEDLVPQLRFEEGTDDRLTKALDAADLLPGGK
jgi:membrane protease subunit HflC